MPVGAFVPSRIHLDYPEWTAPTGGDSGKVWAWNGSGYAPVSLAFDPTGTAAAAVAAHVAAANPHTQYLLASGVSAYGATLIDDADAATARTTLGLGTMATATETAYLLADGSRTGATAARQVFTQGITTGSIRPVADGTAAFQVQTTGGTSVVTVDTTNRRVGINVVPSNRLHVYTTLVADGISVDGNNYPAFLCRASGTIRGYWTVSTTANGFFTGTTLTNDMIFRCESGGRLLLGVDNGIGNAVPGIIVESTNKIQFSASTTTRASLRVRAGTAPTTPNDGDAWNDGNAYALMVNGTNAVNTDGGLSVWMQSSSNPRNVGRLLWQYTNKTDATRITEGSLTAYYQSTERKAVRWSADSGGPTLAFYNGAPVARQLLATGAGATVDDVITALQNLGLVKQS